MTISRMTKLSPSAGRIAYKRTPSLVSKIEKLKARFGVIIALALGSASCDKAIPSAAPALEYATTFKKDAAISKLYQRLRNDGVKDADLDTGYSETDYVNSKRLVTGKNDQKIQAEEVLDYALNKSERYRITIKETMGYEIPWTLDDPAATFDEEIRAKVSGAIAFFKGNLTMAGYREGTDSYNELLATSLYAFVAASDKKESTEIKQPYDAATELIGAGLIFIVDYINSNGGLGVLEIDHDCDPEATALTALEKKCGKCTERSYVLYAVFKMAGLKAEFVFGEFTQSAFQEWKITKIESHLSLSLALKGRTRFYDLMLRNANAETFYKEILKWRFVLSNRETLAFYLNNLGNDYNKNGKFDLAIEEYKKAIQINSNNADTISNLGTAHSEKGELDLAIEEHKKAIKINPNSAFPHMNLGNVYNMKGKLDLAIEEYKKAIQIFPTLAESHYNLGRAYAKKGELDLAIEEHKKAIQINPNLGEAHGNLGFAYFDKGKKEGDASRAIELFQMAAKEFNEAKKNGVPIPPIVFNELQRRIKQLGNK